MFQIQIFVFAGIGKHFSNSNFTAKSTCNLQNIGHQYVDIVDELSPKSWGVQSFFFVSINFTQYQVEIKRVEGQNTQTTV